jgi:methylene-tetrahydromethanopterin dehydrogenase
VGFCAAALAAREGALVTIVGYDGIDRVTRIAAAIRKRFDVEVTPADGSTESAKSSLVEAAEVVLSAGKAGVQVISREQLQSAAALLIAADVNAVPPAGIEGVAVNADGDRLDAGQAVGIGPLAIGNIKYKVESGLFRKMIESGKAVAYDFRDAFSLARDIAK